MKNVKEKIKKEGVVNQMIMVIILLFLFAVVVAFGFIQDKMHKPDLSKIQTQEQLNNGK